MHVLELYVFPLDQGLTCGLHSRRGCHVVGLKMRPGECIMAKIDSKGWMSDFIWADIRQVLANSSVIGPPCKCFDRDSYGFNKTLDG